MVSEAGPLRVAPERVYVIVRNTHTHVYDARTRADKRYSVLATAFRGGGFYLLEADALAQVDKLNKSTKDLYVAECKQAAKEQRQVEAVREVYAREFAAWSHKHADSLKAGRIPREAPPKPGTAVVRTPPSYEQWLLEDGRSWYEVAVVSPGDVG